MAEITDMTDFSQEPPPDFVPRSRTVSFPDHHLIPYFEWCKNNKYVTCSWIILFSGLSLFAILTATNAIDFGLSVPKRIACSFAAVFCILSLCVCLILRFKLMLEYEYGDPNNTVFEILPRGRDPESSNSFEMQQAPYDQVIPNGTSSQTETPHDTTAAHALNDTSSNRISAFPYNGHGRLPRHSISNEVSPYIPLEPVRRPLNRSMPSLLQKENSRLLQKGASVSFNRYRQDYATFENSQLQLMETAFDDSESETEPLFAESKLDNGSCASETKPHLKFSDASETKTHLKSFDVFETKTHLKGSDATEAKTHLKGSDASEAKTHLKGSEAKTHLKGSGVFETETHLKESQINKASGVSETGPILVTTENGSGTSEIEPRSTALTFDNGWFASEAEALLEESTFDNGYDRPETE